LSIDTGIGGTCICIITREDVLALSVNALVGGTFVSITTVHWGVNTSLSLNAGISGARILVITSSVVWGVCASAVRIASINCATNTIITILWGGDHSFLCITSLDVAKIWIGGCHWGVNAFSSSCITLVSGASITVITNNRRMSASCCSTSIDGAFVVITASIIVRGKSAFSRIFIASINGTADTVIADFGIADVSS
jgi:hypothetical protein